MGKHRSSTLIFFTTLFFLLLFFILTTFLVFLFLSSSLSFVSGTIAFLWRFSAFVNFRSFRFFASDTFLRGTSILSLGRGRRRWRWRFRIWIRFWRWRWTHTLRLQSRLFLLETRVLIYFYLLSTPIWLKTVKGNAGGGGIGKGVLLRPNIWPKFITFFSFSTMLFCWISIYLGA